MNMSSLADLPFFCPSKRNVGGTLVVCQKIRAEYRGRLVSTASTLSSRSAKELPAKTELICFVTYYLNGNETVDFVRFLQSIR